MLRKDQIAPKMNPTKMKRRSNLGYPIQTVEMIRETIQFDGTVVPIVWKAPIGPGWGSGDVIQYKNRGWIPMDQYLSDKHAAESEKERQAAVAVEAASAPGSVATAVAESEVKPKHKGKNG